jgi:putative copper export protein
VLIAVLVAAGTYLSFLRLDQPSDLWTTGYGRVLAVKLSLVALALAWGGFHHFVVEPRLERPGVLARLPRTLAGEAAVGMAVLLLAAILVNSKPPSPASGVAGSPAAARRSP